MAENAERLKEEIAYLSGLIKKHKQNVGNRPDQDARHSKQSFQFKTKSGHCIGGNHNQSRKSVYVLDRTKPPVSNPRVNSSVARTLCHSMMVGSTTVPDSRIVHQSNPESLSLEKVKSTNVQFHVGGKNPFLSTKGASSSLVSTRIGKNLLDSSNKALFGKSQFKWSKGGSLSDSELCYKDSSHRKSVNLQSSKNSSTILRTPALSLPVVKGVLPSTSSSYSWNKASSSKKFKNNRTLGPLLAKDSPKPRMLSNTKLRWSKTMGRHKHKILNPYHLVKGKKRLPHVGLKQSTNTKLLPKKSKYKLVKPREPFQSNDVWRTGSVIGLDRRKSSSQNMPLSKYSVNHCLKGPKEGFIQRRKRAILRNALSADVVSRFNVVRTKRKDSPIKAEKSNKLVLIGGVTYRSSANKLSRTQKSRVIDHTASAATLTTKPGKRKRLPSIKKVVIRGVTYIETDTGVLVRSQLPSAKKSATRIIRRSVEKARLSKLKAKQKSNSPQYCIFYNRFGKCNKGERCPYTHDPSRIAICTKYLRGTCKNSDGSCPFSHKVDKNKMPVCQFFLKGRCSNDNCPYSHVNVSRKAAVCQDFLNGYCALGKLCKKKHVLQCEEFSRTGTCSLGQKCKLLHHKNSLRKNKRKLSSTPDKTVIRTSETLPEKKQRKTSLCEGFLPLTQSEDLQLFSQTDNENVTGHSEVRKERDEAHEIRPNFLQAKLKET